MKTVQFLAFFFWGLGLWFPGQAHADFEKFLSRIHPYLTLQEEYTDNFFLSSTNPEEEWITTVSPGIRISSVPEGAAGSPGVADPWGIDLDYRLGLVFHARDEDRNYVSHQGALNTWYSGKNFDLRLREYIIRSEEPLERSYAAEALPNQYLLGTQRERSIYIRNVVEPSVRYKFGREDSLGLTYRNNIYQNENPAIGDSQENFISPQLVYWFNIRNGILLEYGLTLAEFENNPDFTGHAGRGRYTHRFNLRTSVFAEHAYIYRDFESPGIDYDVHNPGLGIEHAFTPATSGRLRLGYFWRNPEHGSSTSGPSYEAALTHREKKMILDLLLQGGSEEDYFTSENLGFTKSNRATAVITYLPTPRVTLTLSGLVGRAEYVDSDRKDWRWEVGGGVSYRPFRWLSLSLQILHREVDSNMDGLDYRENRGILSLSASL